MVGSLSSKSKNLAIAKGGNVHTTLGFRSSIFISKSNNNLGVNLVKSFSDVMTCASIFTIVLSEISFNNFGDEFNAINTSVNSASEIDSTKNGLYAKLYKSLPMPPGLNVNAEFISSDRRVLIFSSGISSKTGGDNITRL